MCCFLFYCSSVSIMYHVYCSFFFFFLMIRRPPRSTRTDTLFPYTTLFRSLVLTSGTTFALNLVAYSWALPRLQPGDAILVSRMEHHANIVPWQLVAERTGATIKVAEITSDGVLDLQALEAGMTGEVKLLAITHVSNVLGTVNPVREICRMARTRGIVTVVAGSQAAPPRAVALAATGGALPTGG